MSSVLTNRLFSLFTDADFKSANFISETYYMIDISLNTRSFIFLLSSFIHGEMKRLEKFNQNLNELVGI